MVSRGIALNESMAAARICRAVPGDQDFERKARTASDSWKLTIGAAVKRAREQRGLSQTALADLIGANLSTISEIERGLTVPSLSTVWSIADRLAVSLDSLVGRQGVAKQFSMLQDDESGTESRSTDEWRPIVADLQRQLDLLREEMRKVRPESDQAETTPTPKGKRSA